MGLRSRVNRLSSRLVGQVDHLEMEDGTRHPYRPEDAREAVFLSQLDVGRAGYHGRGNVELPGLIKAVARATPQARRAFIEGYGDPFRGPSIVGRERAWIRHQWCTLDGELRTELVGDAEAQDYAREFEDLSE